jgi:iron(III) transport system substrate-binding protein
MKIVILLSLFLALPAWAQEGWEKEWNKVLAAAKKEGKVAVMSSLGGAENRQALIEPFQKKYGIEVDYFSSSGSKMVSRIKGERVGGLTLWDIFIGGTSTPMTGLKPGGILDPIEPSLILPEVKEGKNWMGGRVEYADKDKFILVMLSYTKSAIFVNTNLVKSEEFRSVKDLLNPKWKGKILAGDPRFPGPGQATFSYFYAQKELGPDFIRMLAKQDLHFLRDDRQAAEWLAVGKSPLLVGGSDTDVEPFLRQNLPIRILNPKQLKEGGYLTAGAGGLALINKAPNSNAAKVYINWLLSKEGQSVLVKANGYPSRRLDTPTPTEPWKFPAQDGYWVSYNEAAVFDIKEKLIPFLKEIFGERG